MNDKDKIWRVSMLNLEIKLSKVLCILITLMVKAGKCIRTEGHAFLVYSLTGDSHSKHCESLIEFLFIVDV